MARSRTASLAGLRRVSAMRLIATLFLLLTFSVQSYVTQTHIHPGSVSTQKQLPSKDDPTNCPVCQEMLQAGHFVTPSAASLLLPSAQVSIIETVARAVILVQGASHAWRSRAPPEA